MLVKVFWGSIELCWYELEKFNEWLLIFLKPLFL